MTMTDEERQLSLLKGPRQKGEKAPLPTEFQMQCVIADALRIGAAPGWLWSHFPAGEYRTDATGRKLKRMGLKPGWPDLLLIDPAGCHYWLELKRGKSALSEEQAGFMMNMYKRDVPWAVARSVGEAINLLKSWGAIRTSLADQLSTGSSGRAD
jgi:hypothetical protein